MKQLIIFIFLFILTLPLWPQSANAQDKYIITFATQSITIVHDQKRHSVSPGEIKKKPVALLRQDSINTNYGTVSFHILCPPPQGPGDIDYPSKMTFDIYDAVRSSSFRPADNLSYQEIIRRAIKYFTQHGTNNSKAKHKTQVGGSPLTRAFWQAPDLTRELLSADRLALMSLQESLNNLTKDSTVLYLSDATFYEQNSYYKLANDNYQKAYDFNLGSPDEKIVAEVYRQFLIRMGLPDAAAEINDFNPWTQQSQVIALLPFSSSSKAYPMLSANVYASVQDYFKTKTGFNLASPDLTDMLQKEAAESKAFALLDTNVISEQALTLGANYVISGSVNTVQFEARKTNYTTTVQQHYGLSSLLGNSKDSVYRGKINFTLRVLDATTGRIVFSKPYLINSNYFSRDSKQKIFADILHKMGSEIKPDLNSIFPPQILNIDHSNKDGIPDIVTIDAGRNVFSINNHILDNSNMVYFSSKPLFYDVFVTEDININGELVKKRKLIGKLKMFSVSQSFSKCKIIVGGKAIKEYLDKKIPLSAVEEQ